MNTQSNYRVPDANAIPNSDSYANAQMQQQLPAQRMQQNLGMNNFHGRRPDSFSVGQGNSYVSPAQWDRDALAKAQHHDPMLSHPCSDAMQGGNAARSFYQGQIPQPRVDRENEANEDRFQSHQQDMEIEYEDKSPPLTLESLEKKFHDEIFKLLKEQNDAEDAEIIRHKEVIIEINKRYQEKLSALRARQASRREEFLHKESEARLHQHQLAGTDHSLIRMGTNDPHGYTGPTISRTHRGYTPGQLNSFVEGPQLAGEDRSQGTRGRIPNPEGRVYNNAGLRYY